VIRVDRLLFCVIISESGKCNEMAQIIFMLIQVLLLFCCVTTARRQAPLISDDNAKRSGRIAGN
jgi:hypothetical protein